MRRGWVILDELFNLFQSSVWRAYVRAKVTERDCTYIDKKDRIWVPLHIIDLPLKINIHIKHRRCIEYFLRGEQKATEVPRNAESILDRYKLLSYKDNAYRLKYALEEVNKLLPFKLRQQDIYE